MTFVRPLVALALLALLVGCSKKRNDVREWRATDHDQSEEPGVAAQAPVRPHPVPAATGTTGAATASSAATGAAAGAATAFSAATGAAAGAATASSAATAVDGTQIWESLCASCHGQIGTNGRPGRPLVGVRDLSDPAWQASVRDEDIVRAIHSGRGRMPAFRLAPQSMKAVTDLIRSFAPEK